MNRYALRDDQWERIKDLLPGKSGDVGVTSHDNRRFVEAVLYRYRTGIPWRDLPSARPVSYRRDARRIAEQRLSESVPSTTPRARPCTTPDLDVVTASGMGISDVPRRYCMR